MPCFSLAWLCITITTFCHNFQQSPQHFPHSNTEQIIYQKLKASFLGPFSSFSNLDRFLFWANTALLSWDSPLPSSWWFSSPSSCVGASPLCFPSFPLSCFISSFSWHALPEKGCMWGKFTEKFPAWKYLYSTLAFVE